MTRLTDYCQATYGLAEIPCLFSAADFFGAKGLSDISSLCLKILYESRADVLHPARSPIFPSARGLTLKRAWDGPVPYEVYSGVKQANNCLHRSNLGRVSLVCKGL